MNCFNVDLEIGFNFEFGNTQRTLVECEFCLPYLSCCLMVTQVTVIHNTFKTHR